MKKNLFLFSTLWGLILMFQSVSLNAQASFDVETGAVATGYNNVRIPGDQGTLFS